MRSTSNPSYHLNTVNFIFIYLSINQNTNNILGSFSLQFPNQIKLDGRSQIIL